jgi:hypothetical protein
MFALDILFIRPKIKISLNFLVEIAISDLLQIFATEIFRLTSTTGRDRMSPNYAEKRKKHVPKIGSENTRCKGVHVIERPGVLGRTSESWK